MRQRRRIFRWIAASAATGALAVVSAAGSGCAGAQSEAAGAPGGTPVGAAVERGRLQPRLLLTGELAAAEGEAVTVPRSPIRQVQIRWMAEDGSRVEAGAPVVELDNDQVAQEIEEKRLAVSQSLESWNRAKADAALAIADAEFGLVQAEAAREKAELEAAVPENLLSAREYQDRQLALARARTGLDKARQELATARATGRADVEVEAVSLARARREVAVAEEALDALSLEAPGPGIFVVEEHPWENRPFQPGDSVWVGFPLARIPDLSSMVVEAQLPDVDDGRIAVGMEVDCYLDAYPERRLTGRIEEIAEVAEQPSRGSLRRVFAVRVGLEENDPERLRPGMSVKVVVPGDGRSGRGREGEERLLVPRSAIDWSGETPAVRLAGGGGRRQIEVEACDGLRCAVAETQGLAPGTRLEAGEPG